MHDFIHEKIYRPWVSVKASEKLQKLFYENGKVRNFNKGDTILFHSSPVETAFLVDKGLCHYIVSFRDGKETATSLFLPQMTIAFFFSCMSGDIRALTDCVLYEVNLTVFYNIIKNDADLFKEYYELMIFRVSGALTGSVINTQFTPTDRLATFLQILATDFNEKIIANGKIYHSIGYRISHDEISRFLSTNRVTVSKLMAKWLNDGTIMKFNGIIAVQDCIYISDLYKRD